MPWAPDVFHCNDWHTGLLPLYLRTAYAWDQLFAQHAHAADDPQHRLPGRVRRRRARGAGADGPAAATSTRTTCAQGRINFLKTGLLYADALTTVSRTYAEEIQTPEFGMGLEGILQRRRDVLHGIVNGVDYGDWNPRPTP